LPGRNGAAKERDVPSLPEMHGAYSLDDGYGAGGTKGEEGCMIPR